MTVDADGTLLHVVKTADEIDDGGFARTGGSHQGDGFTGGDGEAHVVQDVCTAVVGKRDMGEADFPRNGRDDGHVPGIGDFRFGIHDFKDPFRTRYIGDELGVEIAQIGNGVPKHGNIAAEGDKRTHGNPVGSYNPDTGEIEHDRTDAPAQIDDGTEGVV